jgi:catechol 2,3-dioxygenase-like lactoylglutathione lyase family enzyme
MKRSAPPRKTAGVHPPDWTLRFLYIGTADFERDLAYYRETLGARLVWHFEHFGAKVAAVSLGAGPLFLLADHRPAPSCIPVLQVEDLTTVARSLKGRGWRPVGRKFEIPNGPCYRFDDPTGNPYALFEDVRPQAMPSAFADPENTHAVRADDD